MARYWDNKEVEGRGTKFCLVIDPEDGTHPIRTYGWTQEEVLDKVARTAETAQQVINRQRATVQPAAPAARPTAAPVRTTVKLPTSEELMEATNDLSNPGKSTAAVKTLLRGAGVDVDSMKLKQDAERVGAIAQEWESHNPDFPSDVRNQRLLMDKALMLAGGRLGDITAEILDEAYRYMVANDILFAVEETTEPNDPPTPPDAPNGNSVSRMERPRTATSYRRTALNAPATPVAERKPKYTRAEIDALNSRELREKIEREPGFKDWYDREFSSAT